MRGNKQKNLVLSRKRAVYKNNFNNFSLDYVSPNYFLSKSSFMFVKFSRRFFHFFSFFFKKISFLIKSLYLYKVIKRYFIFDIKKHFFGNFYKFFKNYEKTDYDDSFFFLKKNELTQMGKLYFEKFFFKKNLRGNNYFFLNKNLLQIGSSFEELDNFFYKSSIFSNYIDNGDPLLSFNVDFNFN